MNHSNYIIDTIKIQDYNLKLINITHEHVRGNKTIILNCEIIEDEVISCPICGSIKYHIKDYYERNIKYLEMFGYKSIIRVKQKRVVCCDCNKSYNIQSSIISKGCSISNPTKLKIIQESKSKQSFTDIALRLGVSTTHTISTFNEHIAISRNKLTEIICVDEFKANTEHGKYAFILGDPTTGEIIDILPSRKQEYIYHYFKDVPGKERLGVKYFVSDMFESYRTVKRELFPNAIHIADRFHWIRCAVDSFNSLRIRIMKEYSKERDVSLDIDLKNELNLYIKAMKSNYKLLLANRYRKEESYFYEDGKIPGYREPITRQQIIELIINSSKELETGYFLLQDLYKLSIFSSFDTIKDDLYNWIKEARKSKLKEFKKTCSTYMSWISEIINSFIIDDKTKKRLSNGFMEGKNNFCKIINRISFGYKNFDLLRNRILYTSNEKIIIKN